MFPPRNCKRLHAIASLASEEVNIDLPDIMVVELCQAPCVSDDLGCKLHGCTCAKIAITSPSEVSGRDSGTYLAADLDVHPDQTPRLLTCCIAA